MKNLRTSALSAFLIAGIFTQVFAGDCNALSGDFKIGPSGDYKTISEALTALKCGGVSGPVNFLIEQGKYNERLNVGAINGVSASNTITFEGASGVASDVVLESNTPDAEYSLGINGASYVSFENLTIENKSGTTGNAVRIDGASKNIKFKTVTFNGKDAQATGANNAVIYCTANMPKTNISIEECEINNGSCGLYKGGSTEAETGTSIVGTIFFSQYESAITLYGQKSPVISNNVVSSISNNSAYKAMNFNNLTENAVISNNVVNAVYGSYGLVLNNCEGLASGYGNVTNNSISVGGQNTMIGLFLSGTTDNQVFNFNRVKLTPTSTSSTNQAFYKNAGTGANINLMNNIFFDLNTGGYTILGNTYKDFFNQLPTQSNPSLSVSANGIMIEKVMPAN